MILLCTDMQSTVYPFKYCFQLSQQCFTDNIEIFYIYISFILSHNVLIRKHQSRISWLLFDRYILYSHS